MMEAWMLVGARAEALWMALGARGAGCRTLGREQLRGADAVMPRRKATQPEGEAATRCDSLGATASTLDGAGRSRRRV